MFFITLTKWKQAPTKDIVDQFTRTLEDLVKEGTKIRIYWTLGSYDAVSIIEAPTEKEVMGILLPYQGLIDSETWVAVPREEAIELL